MERNCHTEIKDIVIREQSGTRRNEFLILYYTDIDLVTIGT